MKNMTNCGATHEKRAAVVGKHIRTEKGRCLHNWRYWVWLPNDGSPWQVLRQFCNYCSRHSCSWPTKHRSLPTIPNGQSSWGPTISTILWIYSCVFEKCRQISRSERLLLPVVTLFGAGSDADCLIFKGKLILLFVWYEFYLLARIHC